jgi:hypothetical protein
MQIIAHRKNTVAELKATPTQYGIEVDIRSHGTDLIMHHDPFEPGERFEDWLAEYCHKTLILNVKEEGLEARLVALMDKYQIKDYFFLDQSFPFLIKWSRQGLRQAAVRVSEFEHLETAMTLASLLDWAWVDCFTRFPLTGQQAQTLKSAGFRLCLVSPELQGRLGVEHVTAMRQLLQQENILPDAVCTKQPDWWLTDMASLQQQAVTAC